MSEMPPDENKTQEQLAQEYLTAYRKYEEIMRRVTFQANKNQQQRNRGLFNNGSVAPEDEARFKALSAEAGEAMDAYVAIGKLLTPETKDKYLRVEASASALPPRKKPDREKTEDIQVQPSQEHLKGDESYPRDRRLLPSILPRRGK